MRALLKPVVARELGVVLLKPGSELMSLFSCECVLVESQPAVMERLPAGRVPDVRQPLASDGSLRPFFLDEKVIKAAGGLSGLDYWLLCYGGNCCQWPHSDYHYHELTTMRHEPGSVLLCGHCDDHLRDHYSEQPAELAIGNRWTAPRYLAWIKTQPCESYRRPADDPHHLIGHGQGGMGTKAHDLFVIPLCREHHDELHADSVAFEAKYGDQLLLIFRVIDRALAIGVLA
ncbi:putative cytoplasmic protein [Citrobacter freundii ATCC 8090 = MTCC 1658 = NBRC 12681]|uniref:DUF968 domain-containing protein n=1 Tax=Citrobacter freundii TaxID=546 RepID=UPI000299BE59|nr:DUF968 domain-containing protein [Citrobacter freundii]EKS54528.1 hypothetical protein D186_22281 [Citrobacter freundii ATCC 8090 = MTCC 1658 = NBRC 12681]EXF28106.1 cons domain protein [Citrobacter freundii RLS1]KFB93063.1 putative cytoplasmic protein [Citrobacter freundii ATCC 8090 = MTCC 1658 = NBRC 12681]QIH69442.1 DUF968 domain-containing protein [Citrobacter freundii ATCC 8090 = MTCC 1658 = NBRC 12681]WOY53203.1 DUF968 domain-containing protein [Citrobacter freundii]